jgi:hypothetical protein
VRGGDTENFVAFGRRKMLMDVSDKKYKPRHRIRGGFGFWAFILLGGILLILNS